MESYEDDLGAIRITGVMVSYYFICHTKLWLFTHQISMEKEYENVRIGKAIHEVKYKREKKEISLPGIKMDFIRNGDLLEIHEIKKSRKMEIADRFQVIYYLFVLKKYGVNAIGILNYPSRKESIKIIPNAEDFERIQEILNEIKRVVMGPFIKPEKKKICRKCAYFEFCWG